MFSEETEMSTYVLRKGMYEVADYFRNLIEKRRLENKIPVLVEDYATSLLFVPCDVYGVPKVRWFKFLVLDQPLAAALKEETTISSDMGVVEKEVAVESPLSATRTVYGFPERTYFHLWQGRVICGKRMKVEDLDVKELLNLANDAVVKREGLILDEVASNRLIK